MFNAPTKPPTGNCVVSAILVNPCRPWLGAWANHYPGHSDTGTKDQLLDHESRIGRQVQLAKNYHDGGGAVTLSSNDLYFINRPNTILVTTYKPATNWADAGGGNATVNANIDAFARSIKAVAPHKIILTVWHEPENDVTPSTTSCSIGASMSKGSPAQYVQMWHNVRARFDAQGVSNVVWAVNYMLYQGGTCIVKDLWPGNSYTDWVFADPYIGGGTNYTARMDFTYNWFKDNSDPTHDFNSKPWGFSEWGVHQATQAQAYQDYDMAKTDLDANRYPNIKAYIVFDSTAGSKGGGAVGLRDDGSSDSIEQQHYNLFANDPIFNQSFTGLP